jgi:hypothetical protein
MVSKMVILILVLDQVLVDEEFGGKLQKAQAALA